MGKYKDIIGAHYVYADSLDAGLHALHSRVQKMREVGKLSPQNLRRIRDFFKIKGIYHSNAIEGNSLTVGETGMVVEQGLTLAGKTLRDQAEARNLSRALAFMEELATSKDRPITERDVRQIHELILADIDDKYAGKYRKTEVVISGSRFKPPSAQQTPMDMADLGAYISEVTSGSAQASPMLAAAAVHAWLAQIHPFIDGNGRTARLLMNLVLIRSGYPICIIMREDRLRYYEALEESQAGGDLSPLIELMRENVEESLDEWEKAADEQRQQPEWLESSAAQFEKPALSRARNDYEVWLRAMELLKSYFKQSVDAWNESRPVSRARLYFVDYGAPGFERYLRLLEGGSAKRSWFFRIDFCSGGQRARYYFFFGYPNCQMKHRRTVMLIVAKGIDHGYEMLQDSSPSDIPDIFQIGFDIGAQRYLALTRSGEREGKVETFARDFLEQVIQRDFGG